MIAVCGDIQYTLVCIAVCVNILYTLVLLQSCESFEYATKVAETVLEKSFHIMIVNEMQFGFMPER